MQGAGLGAFIDVFSHNPPLMTEGRCPHARFAEVKTEVPRGSISCPRSFYGHLMKNQPYPKRGLAFVLGFWEVISKPLECLVFVYLGALGHAGKSDNVTKDEAWGHAISA